MIRFAVLAIVLLFAAGFVFLLLRRRSRIAPPSRLPEATLFLTVESAASAKVTIVNSGPGPLVARLALEIEVLREEEVVRTAAWDGGEVTVDREAEVPVALDLGPLEPGEYRLRVRGRYGEPVNLGTHAVAVT